jgi:phosphatidylglycerophosphate synthase
MNIRRPLAIRNNKMMHAMAAWLSKKNVTPNQISLCSVFFALLCTISIVISSGKHSWFAFILSSIFIQGRLLCNLLDGMVAIEGGKKTKSGELFNDIPITDHFSVLRKTQRFQSITHN